MHRLLALTGSLVLAGCAAAPRDLTLDGLDLNSPAVIAQVSAGLPQNQRAAFATFALFHWPESKAYCGRSMFKGALQPDTVGEAIDKTMEFETALARKRTEEKRAGSGFEQLVARKQRLVNEFEQMMIEREMLASAGLSPEVRDRRAGELERRLADNREARDKLAAVPAVLTVAVR